MSIAFVLGNGKSRLKIDLETLRSHGKTYGCNALYRTFKPDVLVATDPEISREIEESGYALDNVFYTREPRSSYGSRKIARYEGYSSGPIALDIAMQQSHSKVFMIGFDLDSKDGRFNNVYAGTSCYKRQDEEPTYYGNWVNQIADIASGVVIRVNDGHVFPDKWEGLIRQINMSDFIDAINNCKLEDL
jgi:hypothetical protein